VSNTSGDDTLAFLTGKEIKEAKFIAPVRNCAAKPFIFTYKRSFEKLFDEWVGKSAFPLLLLLRDRVQRSSTRP
jgi:hypothetical protein